jgi:hypothetical protein
MNGDYPNPPLGGSGEPSDSNGSPSDPENNSNIPHISGDRNEESEDIADSGQSESGFADDSGSED